MPALRARDRVGDRVERGTLCRGEPDQVAEQRRVGAVAAVVRRDAGQVEQRADLGSSELEPAGRHTGGGRDRVARRLQPGIHRWQAIRVSEAPPYSAAPIDVLRLPGSTSERDAVAVEEPLEIRVNGEPVAVTMRTPGHDEELALGFCLTERIEPVAARVPSDMASNTVEVDAHGFDAERLRRSFYTSSSCGVCGKGALEAV